MRGAYQRLLIVAVAAVGALASGAGVGWANDPRSSIGDFVVQLPAEPVYIPVPGMTDEQVGRYLTAVRQTPSEIQTSTQRTLVGLGIDSCTRLHHRGPGSDVAADLARDTGISEGPARTVVFQAGVYLCPEEFQ